MARNDNWKYTLLSTWLVKIKDFDKDEADELVGILKGVYCQIHFDDEGCHVQSERFKSFEDHQEVEEDAIELFAIINGAGFFESKLMQGR